MRNLNLLSIPEELKIELNHAALLMNSLYGIQVDILDFDASSIVVRIIQNKSVDGKIYENKELAVMGKAMMLPLKPYFEACHLRPISLQPRLV
jgi:hypothetical protein